jgi:hypothetical protein
VELPGERELLGIGQLPRPAPKSSSGSGRGESRVGALADQIALELGQGPEEMEDELAARRGGVDLLGQTLEPDPPLRQLRANLLREWWVFRTLGEAGKP